LTDRYGAAVGTWFVVGFFATSITTLLGVWQGVSLIVTDFARETWELDVAVSPERSAPFRVYAAWLTFPPMIMLFVSDPVALVITIGVLGASFLPFLAITLLFLLNSKSISKQWRSGMVSNTILAVGAVLFLYLLVQEIVDYVAG
jgi:Mn2+/Fe2+ NRAMP family transporter